MSHNMPQAIRYFFLGALATASVDTADYCRESVIEKQLLYTCVHNKFHWFGFSAVGASERGLSALTFHLWFSVPPRSPWSPYPPPACLLP